MKFMERYDYDKQYIRDHFSNNYYNYVITVTFKRNVKYSEIHPKKAHPMFQSFISKYLDKRCIKYYFAPELDRSGNLHYHGLMLFPCPDNDYDRHYKQYRLVKNYFNRKFGYNFFQRIYSLTEEYEVETIRVGRGWNKVLTTSFDKIWNYVHKDQIEPRKYEFMDRFRQL